jgi:hypothetical protein
MQTKRKNEIEHKKGASEDTEFVFHMPISKEISLTTKGISIKLDDFATRKAKTKKIFQAQGFDVLMDTLKLFADSKEQELFLCFDSTDPDATYTEYAHRLFFKCERHNNKIYFIAMESLGKYDEMETVNKCFALFAKKYPKLKSQVVFGHNEDYQQTKDKLCTFYMIKNMQRAAKYPDLVRDLEAQYILTESVVNGFRLFTYRLPPIFIALTKSWDNLQLYLKVHKELETKIIRKDKKGNDQTLRQYALHERSAHKTTTPQKIPNRNFVKTEYYYDEESKTVKSKSPDSAEPEFVYENNSVEYFRNKYCYHSLPTLLNSFSSPEERKAATDRIVAYRDARNLAIDPETGEIDNKDVIAARRKVTDETETTFVSAFSFINEV